LGLEKKKGEQEEEEVVVLQVVVALNPTLLRKSLSLATREAFFCSTLKISKIIFLNPQPCPLIKTLILEEITINMMKHNN
jgi:hypothetical protein